MNRSRRHLIRTLAASVLLLTTAAQAAIPSPEKLLPADTLVLVTAPDFSKLTQITSSTPQARLWNDPAMKPFKEKFLAKCEDEFLKPLERDLEIKLADYTALFQGQVTFAITQNEWKGRDEKQPGVLLLVDARDKSDQLKKNLADLRKKWAAAGKSVRTEKVRDVDFLVLAISSNDVPKTIRKFFPKSSEAEEAADGKESPNPPKKQELVVGQTGSLLVLANSVKAAEPIVARLGGGSPPVLADSGAYQANHLALFRDSPLYGWVNAKVFMDIMIPALSAKKSQEASPLDLAPEKVLNALGLSALKTIAATARQTAEGTRVEMFFGVPEGGRQGLFKILAGEPKEANPPSFVPADALKFKRWRIDGQKAWATLQQAAGELSPQAASALNFVLDSANAYAREKDPAFDIRKNLFGNLGDDFVSYEKRRNEGADPTSSGPSLFLLSSPNPEQFVAAMKGILVFLNQQSGAAPQEREFLGRKIYSVPLALPGSPPASGKTSVLSYAASSGYVALSTEPAMIEEYFRSCDGNQTRPLKDLAGLAEAAQKVTGPGCSLFGYENDAETMRNTFELLRKTFAADANSSAGPSLFPVSVSLGGPEKIFKEWFDFSLLPPYDKISKYFQFSVYGGSATADGLTFKMFTPVPPALKQ